jgi:hypothetical protein
MLKANFLFPLPHRILSIPHLSEQKKTVAFVSVYPDNIEVGIKKFLILAVKF